MDVAPEQAEAAETTPVAKEVIPALEASQPPLVDALSRQSAQRADEAPASPHHGVTDRHLYSPSDPFFSWPGSSWNSMTLAPGSYGFSATGTPGASPSPLRSGFQASSASSTRPPFRIGPLKVQTSLNAGVIYTETISDSGSTSGTRSQLGKISQDTGNGFSASLGANFNFLLGEPATGNTLTALYGLSYRYPSGANSASTTDSGEGRLDQQLAVSGNLDLGKTSLRLGISFADLAGPDRDSGGYAERQLFTVTTSAVYRLSAKTTLISSLSLPYREVSGGASASGLSHTASVDYAVDAKLQLGAGWTLGFEKVDGADDETYQRFLPRFSFQLSPRVALSGTCGLEWRQGGNGLESMEPVFDLQTSWTPRLGTSFSFSFGRQVQSSVSLYGTDFVGTTLSLNAVQRLGHRMSLQLSAGLEQADYGANPQSGSPQREDQLFFGQVSLDLDLGRRWSAMLAYYYEENRSSSSGYTSLQAQFQLSLLF